MTTLDNWLFANRPLKGKQREAVLAELDPRTQRIAAQVEQRVARGETGPWVVEDGFVREATPADQQRAGLEWVGVMADEVLEARPDAVVRGPGGLLLVDYSKLGN